MTDSLLQSSLDRVMLGHDSVCVAVLDGLVDLSHPCFEGANLQLVGESEGPVSNHGTHIASLIFGQPGTSVQGVAPRCRGLVVPAFRERGPDQPPGCSQRELARAIRLALEHGAHIINVSGGEIVPGTPGMPAEENGSPELVDAVGLCEQRKVLIVAAAGNDGCPCLHLPAALQSVLAVGAIDESGAPLDSSNWGDAYQSTGVMAPGRAIVGAAIEGGLQTMDGTSCATAIVSGIAALLVSLQYLQDMPADPLEVRRVILASAEPCDADRSLDRKDDCQRLLAGIVCARAAAKLIQPRAMSASSETDLTAFSEIQQGKGGCECSACGAGVASSSAVNPSSDPSRPWTGACRCGDSQLVYFIGELGFNFGRMTRLDSFAQSMPAGSSVHDNGNVLDYIRANPWAASSVIWTIGYESLAVYAVAPLTFEEAGYQRLVALMAKQRALAAAGGVSRISVPGMISGSVDLLCGGRIPVIVPDLRGIKSWEVAGKPAKKGQADERAEFFNRVFYELRSPGLTPDDRAINFAATEAHALHEIFDSAASEHLVLERISVEDSPICRPRSICRDVLLTFFDPKRRFEQARKVHRLTVDVADTVPARIGDVRSWHVY